MGAYEPITVRFWRFVTKTETCWLWTGAKSNGYGRINVTTVVGARPRQMLAHVWSYERHHGPVPEGLTVHHRCGVRACVNPDHLEAITLQRNASIGKPPAVCASATIGTLF